ncbi:hypothetical protein ACB092_02G040000 [Castanea dentata]
MGPSKSKQSSQSSQTTIKDKTLSGLGNFIRLLPTGTVFLYQFLSPYLTAILEAVCGLSCFFSSFIDSYVGDDGKTHYGFVTSKGLWPSENSKNVDLSVYKLQFGDFVHGLFALSMFGVLVLLDPKTVGCFYPVSDSSEKTMLKVFPPVAGMVSSGLFMFFPNKRHGVGYPSSTDSSQPISHHT